MNISQNIYKVKFLTVVEDYMKAPFNSYYTELLVHFFFPWIAPLDP